MRITNKDYTPLAVLAELLAHSPVAVAETARFSEKELSSHEYLLSIIRGRLEAILKLFERLGCESSENQGLDDNGVDILLRFEVNGEPRRIGFQVKSNREADDADRLTQSLRQRSPEAIGDPEDTLLKTLKRQAHEARLVTKVDAWWVLPCFDLNKHKRRFAAINAHFNNHQDPSWPVRIVSPEQVLGLLEMPTADLDAVCTLLLCRDDEVLSAARREFGSLSRAAQNILRDTFFEALHGELEIDDRTFFDAVLSDEGRLDAVRLRDELEASGYVGDMQGRAASKLCPPAFPGLCALYYEGRVRHGLSESAARAFMWRMLYGVEPASPFLDEGNFT